MPLRFFLSYARNDDELHGERLIRPFFDHLVEEVGHHLGESDNKQLGFIDVDMPPSERWQDSVREALCTADTMIAMLSPNYFTRRYCGAEWTVFEQRMQAAGRANRIVPIIWSRAPGWLPPSFAGELVFRIEGTGREQQEAFRRYNQRGLRALAAARALAAERAMYQAIVEEIALRIIALINEGPFNHLPHEAVPSIEGLQPKFPITSASGPSTSGAVGRAPVRSTTARFVALTSGEREPWDWVPFEPPYDESLGLILTRAALAARFQPMWEPLGDIADLIARAERRAEPVVIVIDPHALTEPRYAETLATLDRGRFGNCTLLVAWPSVLRRERGELEAALAEAFYNRSEDGSSKFFRVDISSYADLCGGVEDTLRFLEQRLVSRRQPRSTLPSSPTRSLPSVSATRPGPPDPRS